jgi:ParB family chromosome partitioning protein
MTFRNKGDEWDSVLTPTSASERGTKPKLKRPILIKIDDIVLGGGRQIDTRKLSQLQASIADQGLLHPIHVYKLCNVHKGKYGLAAGQHRLKALKNLGCKEVSAVVIKRKEGKAWRASENLHRKDLNPLEKSLAIVEYAEARQHLPNVNDAIIKGGKQPHDLGISKLAKATGYTRKRIKEAYAHARLPKSVKRAILKRRRVNKVATLNLLIKMKVEEEQLRFIRANRTADRSKNNPMTAAARVTRLKRRGDDNDSSAVRGMIAKWNASSFRVFYEKQSAAARKQFIRQVLT